MQHQLHCISCVSKATDTCTRTHTHNSPKRLHCETLTTDFFEAILWIYQTHKSAYVVLGGAWWNTASMKIRLYKRSVALSLRNRFTSLPTLGFFCVVFFFGTVFPETAMPTLFYLSYVICALWFDFIGFQYKCRLAEKIVPMGFIALVLNLII